MQKHERTRPFIPARVYRSFVYMRGVVPAVLILILGAVASWYAYAQMDALGRTHIRERAATIAVAVPLESLKQLSGSSTDIDTEAYATLKAFLTRVQQVSTDARFLYLIGQRPDGTLFFYADSERPDSEEYSPPGQVYFEATSAMQTFFSVGESLAEGPDRDRWGVWMSGYAPVRDTNGQVIAMLGMDIPATRYLGDLLAYSLLPMSLAAIFALFIGLSAYRQKRELEYLEQKEEFLSIASHEIRTPLTGIRWAVEGLLKRKRTPLDEKTRTVLTLVHESALGLIGRVNDLLDLAAFEGGRTRKLVFEEIAVRAFFMDMIESLMLSAQARGMRITFTSNTDEYATITADRQLLHHAFLNLISNALKYGPPESEVHVSYEHEPGTHTFRVTDSGQGIRAEDQERIFSGYERTEEAVRSGQYGNGLGLFLVRRAAELHHGGVFVTSVPGEGAVFTFWIPEERED